jgi:hypothetical protein
MTLKTAANEFMRRVVIMIETQVVMFLESKFLNRLHGQRQRQIPRQLLRDIALQEAAKNMVQVGRMNKTAYENGMKPMDVLRIKFVT